MLVPPACMHACPVLPCPARPRVAQAFASPVNTRPPADMRRCSVGPAPWAWHIYARHTYATHYCHHPTAWCACCPGSPAPPYQVMEGDIRCAKESGCDGVVVGALAPDGSVDVEATARLASAAAPMRVTFHRAFDMCADPFKAIDALSKIGTFICLSLAPASAPSAPFVCNHRHRCGAPSDGIERVLTSGQQATACAGAKLLGELVSYSGGAPQHHAWRWGIPW